MTRTLIVSYDAPETKYTFSNTEPMRDMPCLTVATKHENTGHITVIRTVIGVEATALYKELTQGKDAWKMACLNRPWETT